MGCEGREPLLLRWRGGIDSIAAKNMKVGNLGALKLRICRKSWRCNEAFRIQIANDILVSNKDTYSSVSTRHSGTKKRASDGRLTDIRIKSSEQQRNVSQVASSRNSIHMTIEHVFDEEH